MQKSYLSFSFIPVVRGLFLSVLISMSLLACAGSSYYFVQFTDKADNGYTISHPEAYLSPRALERRRLQHIPVSQDDMPLTSHYVNAVAQYADRVSHVLRWENAIIIASSDTSLPHKLRLLPFVRTVLRMSGDGLSLRNKQLDVQHIQSKSAEMDTGFYGVASNQNVMIGVNKLHQRGYWGDGVLIAMMDAGFTNINTNVYFNRNFDLSKVLYTWNYVYADSNVYGYDDHGAWTFSDIAAYLPYHMVGTAPDASFLLFVTEDVRSEKIIEEYNWAAAAELADSMGADVFSTSLGYTTFDPVDSIYSHTYADMNGHTTPIAKAVNRAASKGIIVVNSAGNEGNGPWHYIATPGDADSGVAVGAVDPMGFIANFSGYGPNSSGMIKPDVCAQGSTANVVNVLGGIGGAYGTSFSCPITAGAFVCLRQAFPSVPCMALVDAVRRTGSYYTHPDGHYGYGIPDFGRAFEYLSGIYGADTVVDLSRTRLFPMPFTNSIRVIAADIEGDTIHSSMYDMAGRKVWENTVYVGNSYFNTFTLYPPATLADGVYVLNINETYTYRIVKAR